MMKRVARRVTLSLSEAKRMADINRPVFASSATAIGTQWRYRNIFAMLPTATGVLAGSSFAVDGNEIVDPLLKIKATAQIQYNDILQETGDGSTFGSIYFHIYLVAANDYSGAVIAGGPPPGTLTWTTYPAQFSSGDPGWFLSQDGARPTLNGNNVKVIRKWTKKFTPEPFAYHVPTGGTRASFGQINVDFTIKHRFKGKKTFEDNVFGDLDANFARAGTLRGWNYYTLCGWSGTNVLITNSQPQMYLDQFLYFKDP